MSDWEILRGHCKVGEEVLPTAIPPASVRQTPVITGSEVSVGGMH